MQIGNPGPLFGPINLHWSGEHDATGHTGNGDVASVNALQ